MARKGGLGKGLDALFLDNNAETGSGNIIMVRLSQVEPNADQPRQIFESGALDELAQSIKEHGVLQPIILRPMENGGYQIVAGERRWRASRMAGLVEIPAIIKEADNRLTMELALIENLQRQDLNVLEEAKGYKVLTEHYEMTQEEVAVRVGKSRPVVANALRLLTLPQKVLDLVELGSITGGHARILVGIAEEECTELALEISKQGLSVRQAEKLVKAYKAKDAKPEQAPKESDSIWGGGVYKEAQIALTEQLGRAVKITPKGEGGTLEIAFFSQEDLYAIAAALESTLN